MLKDVGEPETEFYFRDKFEVGEIEIAAEADGQVGVGGCEFQVVVRLFADVESSHCADSDVWTRVVISLPGDLQVKREKDVDALYILGSCLSELGGEEMDILGAERHAGRETQVEMFMESEVSEHRHVDARRHGRNFRKPLFAVAEVMAVVDKPEILETHADGETEMPAFEVGIRAVENLVSGLGTGRGGRHKKHGGK